MCEDAALSLLYDATSMYNHRESGPVLTELQTMLPFDNAVSQTPGTSGTGSGATSATNEIEGSSFRIRLVLDYELLRLSNLI